MVRKYLAATLVLVGVAACSSDVLTTSDTAQLVPKQSASLSSNIVVSPGDMHGWAWMNDATDTPCSGVNCMFVAGPATPPAGVGSGQLTTPTGAESYLLGLAAYQGTHFSNVNALSYSTYRQSVDAGNNLAVALQFNVDYDLNDAANGYMGRIVFEPYQGSPANSVPQNTWQTWNTLNGHWWGSRANVTVNNVLQPNPCVQATPCTWPQLLAAFPNIGVHAVYGAVLLKAGSNWPGFVGNFDNLTIGVSGNSTTYDFEPFLTPSSKDSCKDGGWANLKRANGTSFNNQGDCVSYASNGK